MRTKIHRVFWAWRFDQEEKWLNEMSAKGLQLVDVGYCTYIFEEGEPGAYIYRLEILGKDPAHADSVEYIHFVQDTGAEFIGSVFRWAYFRKRTSAEGFDLFSNLDSRIRYISRILLLLGVMTAIELYIGLYNMILFSINREFVVNFIAGCICFILGMFVGYGFLHVLAIRRKLVNERKLHE